MSGRFQLGLHSGRRHQHLWCCSLWRPGGFLWASWGHPYRPCANHGCLDAESLGCSGFKMDLLFGNQTWQWKHLGCLESPKEVWKSNFRQYGQMEKAEVGRVREKRRVEERRAEERRSEKKKSQNFFAGAGKGRKVANHCVFPTICGSRGWKSRLAKAKHIVEKHTMFGPLLEVEMSKKSTSLCREADFEVKSVNNQSLL